MAKEVKIPECMMNYIRGDIEHMNAYIEVKTAQDIVKALKTKDLLLFVVKDKCYKLHLALCDNRYEIVPTEHTTKSMDKKDNVMKEQKVTRNIKKLVVSAHYKLHLYRFDDDCSHYADLNEKKGDKWVKNDITICVSDKEKQIIKDFLGI